MAPSRRAANWARSGEFGTADVAAVADTAMELDRARALVLARELGVASGLLAFHPER
jgi:hypothetical protein